MADGAYVAKARYRDEFFTNGDGLRQHYRDYDNAGAQAPVVLCMPGLTRNAKDFQEIADSMAGYARVIVVEQRGRGDSAPDHDPSRYMPMTYVGDMFSLLAHLGLDQVIAFGTSLGGLLTIIMQATRPGVFKAAIINDIGPEVDPAGIEHIKSFVGKTKAPETWAEAVETTSRIGKSQFPNYSAADWAYMTRKLYADVDGKPVIQYDPLIARNFDQNDQQAAPDLWPVFAAMHSVPTLVIRGELSNILSEKTLARMEADHPDLTSVTIPGIGHAPMLWEPESMQAVDQFMKRFL